MMSHQGLFAFLDDVFSDTVHIVAVLHELTAHWRHVEDKVRVEKRISETHTLIIL